MSVACPASTVNFSFRRVGDRWQPWVEPTPQEPHDAAEAERGEGDDSASCYRCLQRICRSVFSCVMNQLGIDDGRRADPGIVKSTEQWLNTRSMRRTIQKAFPEHARSVKAVIQCRLPLLIEDTISTRATHRAILFAKEGRCSEVKVRYYHNTLQILTRSWLGLGSQKIVLKVAILAGPSIEGAPGDLFAYAKPARTRYYQWNILSLQDEISLLSSKGAATLIAMNPIYKRHGPQGVLKGAAMPFYGMGTLHEYKMGVSQKAFTDRMTIMCDVVGALKSLHSNNIIHGDLKPANIFLHKCGKRVRAVVGDLGLAIKGPDFSHYFVGTPPYVAPEMGLLGCKEGFPTPAVDMWVVGLLLTGLFCNSEALNEYAEDCYWDYPEQLRYDLMVQMQKAILRSLDLSLPIQKLIFDLLAIEPADRPSAAQVFYRLSWMLNNR